MISIVLGAYNGEKYIQQQLDSIMAQTYKNFELIVVDDFSTDNTIAIVEEYTHRYKNVFLFKATFNLGYIKNFERGVKLTKGEYIAFSDQDDYWYPNKLEVLRNNIGNYDVVYCDSEFVDEHLNVMGKQMSTNHNMLSGCNPLNFSIKNCVSGHAMLFKKSLLKSEIKFPNLIPHDWWVTFLASGNNGVKFVNQVLVKYRIHNNNVIAGEGHKKVGKVEKIKKHKHRINMFLEVASGESKNVIKKISKSYESNSLVNRFRRMFVFLLHAKPIFAIPRKNILKKYFYAVSMFFKVR